MDIPYLDNHSPFPDPAQALSQPNGLLAVGGKLTSQRLIDAYQHGIFPWYSEGEPLLWWSPDPRAVLDPTALYISRSLAKLIKNGRFTITLNTDFYSVIQACAAPRSYQQETWISDEMIKAYLKLHQQGQAHSIEVWQGQQLVGGLYGIAVGRLFCGESMFHTTSNASKVAMAALCYHFNKHRGKLIDCQIPNDHLESLGSTTISRQHFINLLTTLKKQQTEAGCWIPQIIKLRL